MSGTHDDAWTDANENRDDQLPDRFDERVSLEIEDGANRERPLVRMRDADEEMAWVAASIDVIESLSECR